MSVADLPLLNACLNSASTLFIATGWFLISKERKVAHMVCMIAAIVTSTLFLVSYVIYHLNVGSVKFTGPAPIRVFYLVMLATHVVLAFAVPPLVIMSVVPALRARFDQHRKIGRITMPIWLYVSVTGVLVYLFLYVFFPAPKVA
jgi:uncharacterized membrane protein YozB (DUF420 family)